jgi:hypothetical protein
MAWRSNGETAYGGKWRNENIGSGSIGKRSTWHRRNQWRNGVALA